MMIGLCVVVGILCTAIVFVYNELNFQLKRQSEEFRQLRVDYSKLCFAIEASFEDLKDYLKNRLTQSNIQNLDDILKDLNIDIPRKR